MRTVSCVGSPSSSTLSDPRRQGMVPLSTTVHFSLATRLPIRPAKAEVFLRLKSASSPWPTASCSRTPGHPGPRTTSISPAGASRASSCRMAWRADSLAKNSGFLSPKKKSRATRPPPPEDAAGGVALGFRDAGDIHAGERLRVFGEGAVGGDDENVAEFVGVAGADFVDARIVGAGGFVGAHDQFDLGADFGVDRRERDGVEAARCGFLESGDGGFRWSAGDQARRCGRRAGCGRRKDRRCRRIRCARRRRRGRRIRRRCPGDADFTMDSSTISEVEERYSK